VTRSPPNGQIQLTDPVAAPKASLITAIPTAYSTRPDGTAARSSRL